MPPVKGSRKGRKHRTAIIPYVKGFRPPTPKKQIQAIDSEAGNNADNLPKEFQPTSFEPIPKCTSVDDWLAQYKEDGQTYEEFMEQTPWLSVRKRRCMKQTFVSAGTNLPEKYPNGKIYILPLGEFNSKNSPAITDLSEYASIFLSLPVEQLPPVQLEERGGRIVWIKENKNGSSTAIEMKSRYNKSSGRYQLCVDTGLVELRGYMPDDGICMIALTMSDLFESKPDLFVAGMASGRDRAAIFSLLRYDPNLSFSKEFWYDIQSVKVCKQEERLKLLMMRSCRLLVHELSHLLGVDHCIYYSCCMNGSGHLEEDFRQPMFLCPVDLKKLQRLCGFDVLKRYKLLKDFFAKHKITEDVEWLDDRIHFLQ